MNCTLYLSTTFYYILQYSTLFYNNYTLYLYSTTLNHILQHSTTFYNTLPHSTTLYHILQHSTTFYKIHQHLIPFYFILLPPTKVEDSVSFVYAWRFAKKFKIWFSLFYQELLQVLVILQHNAVILCNINYKDTSGIFPFTIPKQEI